MKTKPKPKQCKSCNKEFKQYKSTDKYCSPKCALIAYKPMQAKTANKAKKTLSKSEKEYRRKASAYRRAMISDHGYEFCERCGITGTPLETHHIVYRSERPNHPNLHDNCNLIRVCVPCHNHYHKSRSNRRELIEERKLIDVFGPSIIK